MYNDCFAANDRQASATPEPAPDTAGEGPESSAAQSEKTRPTTGRSRKKQRGPEQTDPKSSAGDDKMDTEPVSVSLLIKQGIKQLESATTGSPARQVAAFFTSLPSKRDYPDYYMFIKSPISLKEIRNKSEKEKYPNLEEWSQDVKLMCENAKFYNEPGSMVYENAEVMEVSYHAIKYRRYFTHADFPFIKENLVGNLVRCIQAPGNFSPFKHLAQAQTEPQTSSTRRSDSQQGVSFRRTNSKACSRSQVYHSGGPSSNQSGQSPCPCTSSRKTPQRQQWVGTAGVTSRTLPPHVSARFGHSSCTCTSALCCATCPDSKHSHGNSWSPSKELAFAL